MKKAEGLNTACSKQRSKDKKTGKNVKHNIYPNTNSSHFADLKTKIAMNYKSNSIRLYEIGFICIIGKCTAYTLNLNLLSNQKQ